MKTKIILIFPNGSLNFCNKSLFSSNLRHQYLFIKKDNKTFFLSENKTINLTTSEYYLNIKKNYFK